MGANTSTSTGQFKCYSVGSVCVQMITYLLHYITRVTVGSTMLDV